MGTIMYGQHTLFDNLAFWTSSVTCGGSTPAAGSPISLVECAIEVGHRDTSSWMWTPSTPGGSVGSFALAAAPTLCMAVVNNGNEPVAATNPWPVVLAPCSSGDASQIFALNYTQLYQSSISHLASGRCLDIYGQAANIGAAIDAWPCNGQQFYYDYHPNGEIISIDAEMCLGTC